MYKRKPSKWPDLGLLFETRVCPGSEHLAEIGKSSFNAADMIVKLHLWESVAEKQLLLSFSTPSTVVPVG